MPDTPERVDILDSLGRPSGQILSKSEAHIRSLHHAGAHLWIFNDTGEILLQKRADHKELAPGAWDISAAGHVKAKERPEQAAVRETYEELGLHIAQELEFIGITAAHLAMEPSEGQREGWIHQPFNWTYVLRRNVSLSEITFNDDEVSQVAWMPLEQFAADVRDVTKRSTMYGQHDTCVYEMAIAEIAWRLAHG